MITAMDGGRVEEIYIVRSTELSPALAPTHSPPQDGVGGKIIVPRPTPRRARRGLPERLPWLLLTGAISFGG